MSEPVYHVVGISDIFYLHEVNESVPVAPITMIYTMSKDLCKYLD